VGKEAQFSRVKMAAAVTRLSRGSLTTLGDPSAAIGLDLMNGAHHHARRTKQENMKNRTQLVSSAVSVAMFALLAPTSFAQNAPAAAKVQAVAQQLNLTPQQKEKILPILADELPKMRSIKNDNSLSKIQKVQKLRAIHQQTDPQMKAILSPEQYQKLQGIRRQEIRDATEGHLGH